MIFLCVGSREYQFNRLLKTVDELIEDGIIEDEVYAQIGQSDYLPKKYKYTRYMSQSEFEEKQEKASLIISHGGTGALIGALKKNKQVIAVPRLERYKEHTDDHQTQVSTVLGREKYLKVVLEMNELGKTILDIKQNPIVKKYDRISNVLEIIDNYIIGNIE